jgi:hypothetical protein
MTIGKLHISFDFEIGWGVWENGRWRERQARGVYRDLRPALRRFIDFLDVREISLSWAAVGGMISDSPAAHLDHLPVAAQNMIRGFLADAEEPTRDGRDLFAIVAGSKTGQQIGSHSFSHTRFTYPGYDLAAQTEDLRLARAALAQHGVTADMFVFPVNDVASWPALAANGFRVGRTRPVSETRHRGRVGRLLHLVNAGPPPVAEQVNAAGVCEHSGSLFYNWFGRSASLRRPIVNRQARMSLASLAQGTGDQHWWLHPWNLVDTPGLFDDLTQLLDYAAKLRDQGRMAFAPF